MGDHTSALDAKAGMQNRKTKSLRLQLCPPVRISGHGLPHAPQYSGVQGTPNNEVTT